MPQPLGIYVSVPFCRAKCTFCNFASDAFPPERIAGYVERVVREVEALHELAASLRCDLPGAADSVYLGGGTPSLLEPAQLKALFDALHGRFRITSDAEITLEAAPGQIRDDLLDAAMLAGVSRISLGVQSFVDRESRAVGRLHTGAACHAELTRLQRAGVPRLSLDLIAGLPFQTAASWAQSLRQVSESGVEHVSVYMLETDGESRLGSEVERLRATSQMTVLGQEARYHAGAVPSDELVAELYAQACETLSAAGFLQYEISNFARPGAESRHNAKYWERVPYVGLGLDAHSMLQTADDGAVRFQNADELDGYLAAGGPSETMYVTEEQAFEEAVFLGLRLTRGLSFSLSAESENRARMQRVVARARELADAGLMTVTGERIALTPKGRVLSSSIFGELLATP